MVAVFYTKTNSYVVERCIEDDIAKHYEMVSDIVTDVDKDVYLDRMRLSVKQGNAFKLDDSFLYLYTENRKWYGASVFASDVLFLVMLMVCTSKLLQYRKIEFVPHKGMISKMKSMIDGSSIRLFRTNGGFIPIRVDGLIEKFRRLFECIGVMYECSSEVH